MADVDLSFIDEPLNRTDFIVRTWNCLEANNIFTWRDLVGKTKDEMLQISGFGHKCLNAVKEILARRGLRLGMELPPTATEPQGKLDAVLTDPEELKGAQVRYLIPYFHWHDLADQTNPHSLHTSARSLTLGVQIRDGAGLVDMIISMEVDRAQFFYWLADSFAGKESTLQGIRLGRNREPKLVSGDLIYVPDENKRILVAYGKMQS